MLESLALIIYETNLVARNISEVRSFFFFFVAKRNRSRRKMMYDRWVGVG